jgi:hypothetical protein
MLRVHEFRVAQISDGRKYQEHFNKLARSYRRLLNRGERQLLTPQEQALMDKQQHDDYVNLPVQEQQKLKGEIDVMWGQIPEHLQEKAQKLAGLR